MFRQHKQQCRMYDNEKKCWRMDQLLSRECPCFPFCARPGAPAAMIVYMFLINRQVDWHNLESTCIIRPGCSGTARRPYLRDRKTERENPPRWSLMLKSCISAVWWIRRQRVANRARWGGRGLVPVAAAATQAWECWWFIYMLSLLKKMYVLN